MEFIDLKAQQEGIRDKIDARIKKVLDHGQYIMGPEVFELEEKLSEFCGAKHVITCANGTEALMMPLMAKGFGKKDAVFVPAFTFAATAEAVVLAGATPVFVDVKKNTFNMCTESLKAAITVAKSEGLQPAAVIPVGLFGQPADFDAIEEVANTEELFVLDDAAQSFGSTYKGRKTGTLGDATATSFFPAKPLGCYGDGGAVFTDDDHMAEMLRSIRIHGKGKDKYENVRIGLNSRLDTIQAAILLAKLEVFADELVSRRTIAARYSEWLHNVCRVPAVFPENKSSWAQFTLVLDNRDQLTRYLGERGIPTVIYYPKALHKQTAFLAEEVDCPVSEALAETVFSIPMHPYLSPAEQRKVIDAICSFFD
ncbi:MAG: dTDP-4-amino-4,6-dideoxygalactose transaminase [Candidatus Azotimanducaceae bacterium]|jgi:dTDP-4-amino-4,6-dideoxygalactose transaminase